MNEKTELIGILGLGFLGKALAALTSWEEGSWGSWHSSPISSCPLEQFHFDWEGVSSWSEIPEKSAVMILTIPPPKMELERLKDHLGEWKEWMQKNRPMLRRLVLISTCLLYTSPSPRD